MSQAAVVNWKPVELLAKMAATNILTGGELVRELGSLRRERIHVLFSKFQPTELISVHLTWCSLQDHLRGAVQTKLVRWHIVHLYFISMVAVFMLDSHKGATKKAFTLEVLEAEYTELEWNTRTINPQYSPSFSYLPSVIVSFLLEFESIKTSIHARHWNKIPWVCFHTLLAFQLVPLTQKEGTLTLNHYVPLRNNILPCFMS